MEFEQYIYTKCHSKAEKDTVALVIAMYRDRMGALEAIIKERGIAATKMEEGYRIALSNAHGYMMDMRSRIGVLEETVKELRERDCTKLTIDQIKRLRRPDLPPRERKPNKASNKAAKLKFAQTLRDNARTTIDKTVAAKLLTQADDICRELAGETVTSQHVQKHVEDQQQRKTKRQFIQKINDEVAIDSMIRSKKSLPKVNEVVLHDKAAFEQGLITGKIRVEDKAVVAIDELKQTADEISDYLSETTLSDFTTDEELEAREEVIGVVKDALAKKIEAAKNVKLAKKMSRELKEFLSESDGLSADEMIEALSNTIRKGVPALTG